MHIQDFLDLPENSFVQPLLGLYTLEWPDWFEMEKLETNRNLERTRYHGTSSMAHILLKQHVP
jgi:hypothetical protein